MFHFTTKVKLLFDSKRSFKMVIRQLLSSWDIFWENFKTVEKRPFLFLKFDETVKKNSCSFLGVLLLYCHMIFLKK